LGVDRQALQDYTDTTTSLYKEVFQATFNEGSYQPNAQEMQAKSMALVPIAEKLMTKGMAVDIEANGEIFKETNSLSLNLKLLDNLTMADSMMFAFAPQEAFKKLNVSFNTSIKKSLVENIPLVTMATSNPLFSEKKNAYELDIKLGENPTLNSENVTFEELQQIVMSSMQ